VTLLRATSFTLTDSSSLLRNRLQRLGYLAKEAGSLCCFWSIRRTTRPLRFFVKKGPFVIQAITDCSRQSFQRKRKNPMTKRILLRLVLSLHNSFRSWFPGQKRAKATLLMGQSDIFHGSSAPNGGKGQINGLCHSCALY
jgi:hypothetical protein